MCALGAAYVYSVVGRLHVVTVAFWLAFGASVCLGALAGGLRDRHLLLTACMIGTLVLTTALECGWVATFFVPVPGGSGGVGEIVAPFFLAVIGIPLFLAVMAVVLGVPNLFGLAVAWHRRPSRPAPWLSRAWILTGRALLRNGQAKALTCGDGLRHLGLHCLNEFTERHRPGLFA
jgi:hypothetical protein